ncbi:MAG: electron transfer flavoprotein subunit alpha/FixB family protein, partial [Proteobacteria bacterium]|nr:electron transfer flavoprotein subunit alpha/FixB family protein [Pseudomonadota bacterium]
MARVLIVAEHDGRSLNPSTAKCVSCARSFETSAIDIAVLAGDGGAVAAQAAALAGVTGVIRVDHPANEGALAAVAAPQVCEMAADYTHVFGPSTTFGKDLMPRVAALLGVGQLSDIMSAESAWRFKRPFYAGNAILTVEAPQDRPVVATVRTASYQAAESTGKAPIREQSVDAALPA